MKLPNADRAVVEIAKVRDYCLNFEHLRGRHKARVFAAALGLTAAYAEELRAALLKAALSQEATPTERDQYGQRFVLDFIMQVPAGQARVRSTWIVRESEGAPRPTSCFVL